MTANMKGPTDSAVKWLTGKISQAGCRGVKVVFKADQEESMIALKKAVAIKRQAPTVSIESPVRDSQANCNAERAVRTWAAQFRTMRHHLVKAAIIGEKVMFRFTPDKNNRNKMECDWSYG